MRTGQTKRFGGCQRDDHVPHVPHPDVNWAYDLSWTYVYYTTVANAGITTTTTTRKFRPQCSRRCFLVNPEAQPQ
eukprot:1603185-Rhodomonas_salina.3